MLKRILYGVGFAVLLTSVVLILFFRKQETIVAATIREAVPLDALVVIDQIDYRFFTTEYMANSEIWNAVNRDLPGQKADSSLNRFVSQLSRVELLQNLFLDKKTGLSIHLVGKEDLVPLFYLNFSDKYSEKEFKLIIEEILGDEVHIEKRKYESVELNDVTGPNPWLSTSFTFALSKGLLIVSPLSVLVEESVRNLQMGVSLLDDPGFRRVAGSAGRNVHGNVFINYPVISRLFIPLTDKNYRWRLDFPGALADWGEADINLKKDAIALTGMTWASDSAARGLSIFKGQVPVKVELTNYIPSNAVSALMLGISDLSLFKRSFRTYLEESGEYRDFDEENNKLKDRYGINPMDDVLALIDNEIGWFTTNDSDLGEQEVTVIETRSRSLAESMLENWVNAYVSVSGNDSESLTTIYRVDDQTAFKLVRLGEPLYKKGLAGRIFNRYYTVYDNLLLSGSSEQALTRTIYQNILHKTLATDQAFSEVSSYFASKANVSYYFKPLQYLDMKQALLAPPARAFASNMRSFLGGISGVVLQFVCEDELFYQNLSLKYSVLKDEKALTLWESLLDTVASSKPALVINANTQEKEIFVQDAKNTIYLINSAGRILWRKKLDGPILSEIYQIDFYKNGKLQYLFNTPDRLHLIDRNSNNVERYPINFRSRATNAMSLFDYDNKGEYRIFIAGSDRRIYVYDKAGNIVTGWNFGMAERTITKEIQHFRVRDKDYIVFSDGGRNYLLDRQGRERVQLSKRIPASASNLFYLDMNIRENKPRLVCTDTSGNVIGYGFDGEVKVIMEHSASPEHLFRMQDMDQDGIADFIFADKNELTVFSGSGKKLYTYRVRGNIAFLPDIYRFSASEIKVGITEEGQNRIYLVNSDGSLYEGFPLEGLSRFSIGNFSGSESRFNLIVGSPNSFLYNYSIE